MVSKTKTAKKPTAKPTTAPEPSGRVDIYQIVYDVISQNGGKLTPEKLEEFAQKVKPASSGRYAAYGRSNFVNKDEYILPEVSVHGFKVALIYSNKRGLVHWSIQKFPKQAEAAAKELGLQMPKVADPASSSLQETTVSGKSCPQCEREDKISEIRRQRGVDILPEEVEVLKRHGITDVDKAWKEFPLENANYTSEVLAELGTPRT